MGSKEMRVGMKGIGRAFPVGQTARRHAVVKERGWAGPPHLLGFRV